jgi:hypothetical protein
MELTHGSETAAQYIVTPGKYPKEHLQESACLNPILFSKKDDSVPSILTALLVFCTHVLQTFIDFLEILNSSIHLHIMSLCMESYAF